MIHDTHQTEHATRPIRDIIRFVETIPPLPIIIAHALQLSGDDDVSVVSLAHALEADSALTAKLLRSANSAFYGLAQRVYTVRDAIQIIGFEAVRSLAVATTVVGGLWLDDELFDKQQFWRHSLRCGLFARCVALKAHYPKPDVVFTLGVLHDVGRVAIIQSDPNLFRRALEIMNAEGMQLWRVEKAVFGADHAEIGSALAAQWSLPAEYVAAIRGHHEPSAAGTEHFLAHIIALADSLAHSASPHDRLHYLAPPLIHDLWDPLGLDENTVRAIYAEREYIEYYTKSLYETALLS